MSPSLLSRRWIAAVALASDLLAATVSGMLHNHGDECCAQGQCATEGKSQPTECRHTHRHHHAHSAAGHQHSTGHDVATNGSAEPGRKSDGKPGRHGPLHHSDCAACQFLAQQSITTPRCVLVATVLVAPHVSDAVESLVTTVVADAHPARGPPSLG